MRVNARNILTVRRKKSGKILKVEVGDFYKMIRASSRKPNKNKQPVKRFEILTALGWYGIRCIGKRTNKSRVVTIRTPDRNFHAIQGQVLVRENQNGRRGKILINDLKEGHFISTENGIEEVRRIIPRPVEVNVFEIDVKAHRVSIFVDGVELVDVNTKDIKRFMQARRAKNNN